MQNRKSVRVHVSSIGHIFRLFASTIDENPILAAVISAFWIPAIVLLRVCTEGAHFGSELLRTDPYEPSLFLTVLVSAWIFQQLRTTLVDTVSKLVEKGTLEPLSAPSDASVSLAEFRLTYIRSFNSQWRVAVIVLSLVVAISAAEMNGMGIIPRWPMTNFSWDNLRSYVRGGWTLLLLWFLWQPLITGIFVSRLDTKFSIRSFPLHPDLCGGLKPLGDCCLRMALPFVVIAVMLLIWAFAPFSYHYQGMPEFSLLTLLLVLFPIALFAFLRPLWNVHGLMCSARDQYQHQFAEVLRLRWATLGEPGAPADILLTNFDKIRNEFERLPTWPFRWKPALSLFSPQIFAIAKLVFGALPSIYLKH